MSEIASFCRNSVLLLFCCSSEAHRLTENKEPLNKDQLVILENSVFSCVLGSDKKIQNLWLQGKEMYINMHYTSFFNGLSWTV